MSINRDLAKALAAAVGGGTIDSSGALDAPPGVTAYDYDSSGGLLLASTTDHGDGSLHWLGEVNELYVWDSAATKYYLVENTKTLGLGEIAPTQAQGSTYGFATGGFAPGGNSNNSIGRFSFANESTTSSIGNLTVGRQLGGSNSSSTHGYYIGGYIRPGCASSNIIDKFSMASSGNATDVGDDTGSYYYRKGGPSPTHGYHAGANTGPGRVDIVRYSFSSDGNATDVGDLAQNTTGRGAFTSTTHTYICGHGMDNQVEKFAHSTSVTGSSVGDIGTSQYGVATNDATAGYFSRMSAGSNIQKHLFASDATASTAGTINSSGGGVSEIAVSSSTTAGYYIGAQTSNYKSIEKFVWANEGSTSDVGDMGGVTGLNEGDGQQY